MCFPLARIVVVDDDRDFIEFLGETLSFDGHETLKFYQGIGTYRILRDLLPDLVMVYIRMEQAESGWALLDLLKMDPVTQSIPVIVCSADVHRVRGRQDWMDEHAVVLLEKPFDLQVFLSLVAEGLAESKQRVSSAAY